MADDEGRFRALHSVILGHVFPYDADAPKKLGRWMNELLEQGLIDLYQVGEKPYGRLPAWSKNQRISHPRESDLPSLNGNRAAEGAWR